MLSAEDMLALLRAAVTAEGSIKAFADKHRLSPSYLGSVMKGFHPISDGIAAALGYRRDFCFYPLQTPTTTEETANHD